MRWIAPAFVVVCACGPVVSGDDGASGETTSSPMTAVDTGPSPTTAPTGPSTDPTTLSTSGNPTTAPSTDPSDPSDTTMMIDPTEVDPTCNFGCLPDFGGGEQCDVWSQDCARGSKCMPWAFDGDVHWNGTKCSPLDPNPAQLGDPCTAEDGYMGGVDNCDVAQMCMFVDPETNEGVCVSLCMGSEDNPICEDDERGCSIDFSGFMINCLPWCDPLLQDCAQGGCYPTADDAFVCGPTIGIGALPGDACEYHWDCAAGGLCMATDQLVGCDSGVCCAAICDLLDPSSCEDATCSPWFADGTAPPGLENVGVCTGA